MLAYRRTLLCLLLWIALGSTATAWSTLENWADVVLLQMRAKQPLPALSAYGAGLSLADAYQVQRVVVRELSAQSPIVGFKAELTTPLSQVRMHATGPISSAVLKRDLLQAGADVGPAGPGEHSIAPAIGFLMKRRIATPLANTSDLAEYLASAVPVVMVLDQKFENRAALKAEDLVAVNGAHTHLIVGKTLPNPAAATVDALFMEILHEDNVIERAKATNVMGGQYQALLWLVNALVGQGLAIVPGQILVTGPLSEPMPISPGTYVVNFWDHEKIRVTLRGPGA